MSDEARSGEPYLPMFTWAERRARLREIYENRDGDLDEIAEGTVPPELDPRAPEELGECLEGTGEGDLPERDSKRAAGAAVRDARDSNGGN